MTTLIEILFFGIVVTTIIMGAIIWLAGILIVADMVFSKDEHDEHENTDERIG